MSSFFWDFLVGSSLHKDNVKELKSNLQEEQSLFTKPMKTRQLVYLSQRYEENGRQSLFFTQVTHECHQRSISLSTAHLPTKLQHRPVSFQSCECLMSFPRHDVAAFESFQTRHRTSICFTRIKERYTD